MAARYCDGQGEDSLVGLPQLGDYPIGSLVHEVGDQHGVRQRIVRRHFAGRPLFQLARSHDPVRDGGTVIIGGIGVRVIRGTPNHHRASPGIANVRRASVDYFKHIGVQNELAVVVAHGGFSLGI